MDICHPDTHYKTVAHEEAHPGLRTLAGFVGGYSHVENFPFLFAQSLCRPNGRRKAQTGDERPAQLGTPSAVCRAYFVGARLLALCALSQPSGDDALHLWLPAVWHSLRRKEAKEAIWGGLCAISPGSARYLPQLAKAFWVVFIPPSAS